MKKEQTHIGIPLSVVRKPLMGEPVQLFKLLSGLVAQRESHFRSNTTSNTSIARSPSSESSPLVLVGARSRSPNAARRCPPSSSCISNRNPTSSPSRLAASPLITVNAGSFTVSDRICRPNTPFLSIYFIF